MQKTTFVYIVGEVEKCIKTTSSNQPSQVWNGIGRDANE